MRAKRSKKRIILAIVITAGSFIALSGISNNFNKKLSEKDQLLANYQNQASTAFSNTTDNLPKAVVAKGELPAGSKLAPEMLELKGFDQATMPPNSISDVNVLTGLTLLVAAKTGDPITRDKIREFNTTTLDIPTGMRAITIPVENIQGLASYITVGSRVDIVSTAKDISTPNPVAQNVKILAFENGAAPASSTGTTTAAPAGTAGVTGVTVQVPAKIAITLVNAMVQGKLQLLSRNNADNEIMQTSNPKPRLSSGISNAPPIKMSMPPLPGMTPPGFDAISRGLGGLPDPAKPTRKEKPKKKVEIIRSNQQSSVSFDE